MAGMLLGVLLGRTVSGWIASLLGWRAVFLVTAGIYRDVCAADVVEAAEAAPGKGSAL